MIIWSLVGLTVLMLAIMFLLQRSRPVPVIIPPDAKEALSFLADKDKRNKAGILDENNYMFPNSGLYF